MHNCKCLCGDVEFEINSNLKQAINCHCKDCRKSHAAPYVTVLVVLPEYFKITKGQDKLQRYPADLNKTGRFICGSCGSKLYTESTPGRPLSVHTSALEQEEDVEVMAHVNIASKNPNYQFTDELPKFNGHITKDDYMALVAGLA